eukprot:1262586-Alexandrium_andersonii.AAC.1
MIASRSLPHAERSVICPGLRVMCARLSREASAAPAGLPEQQSAQAVPQQAAQHGGAGLPAQQVPQQAAQP